MSPVLVNQTPQWQALQQHWEAMRLQRMRDLFDADPKRAAAMSLTAAGLHLDYSKNLITRETLDRLIELAEAVDLKGWIRRMFERRADQQHRGARGAAHRTAQPLQASDPGRG
jgi:glucose-6-phosphate isomerase